MTHSSLTKKQQEFFDFIITYKNEQDTWPTYREISDYFDFKSPNSVTQNIQALIKKRYLVKDEEDYDLHPRLKNSQSELGNENSKEEGIPIRGLIAAGFLQDAVEANLGRITLETIFPNLDKIFALKVRGNSMKNAGILDGDLVLLMDSDVRNGDIGAVLYNGQTSLKKVFMNRDGLRLEPANEEYDDIIIEPDIFEEVRVIGKYIGHVNKLGIHKVAG